MAGSVLVDAGFPFALLSRRDAHHGWAAALSPGHPPPWRTCDAVLSEAFHLLGARGGRALAALLKRRAVVVGFDLGEQMEYASVPMSLADACLVRMSETLPDPSCSPRTQTSASTGAMAVRPFPPSRHREDDEVASDG